MWNYLSILLTKFINLLSISSFKDYHALFSFVKEKFRWFCCLSFVRTFKINNMSTLMNIPGCFISLQFVMLAVKLNKESKLCQSGWA